MKKVLLILWTFIVLTSIGQAQILRTYPFNIKPTEIVEGEECTQNLVTWSEVLTNPVYTNNGNATITASNAANDMNGQPTLEEITFIWTNGLFGQEIVACTPGLTYRFSFEAKRGTATAVSYMIGDHTHYTEIVSPTSYYASINASTPTRVSIEFVAPTGCTELELWICDGSSEGGTMYAGRVQLETNGSCYITTTTTIITP